MVGWSQVVLGPELYELSNSISVVWGQSKKELKVAVTVALRLGATIASEMALIFASPILILILMKLEREDLFVLNLCCL